jgi:hypothetical protein
VPLINSRLERSRARERISESRLDELRSVFDEAAVALDRALRMLPTWEVVAQVDVHDDRERERAVVAAYADSRKAVEAVGAQAARIAVRLGESSPAFIAYDRARQRLVTLHHNVIADDAQRKIPGKAPGSGPLDPEEDSDFTEGRRQFRQAASDVVGPHLPRRARSSTPR